MALAKTLDITILNKESGRYFASLIAVAERGKVLETIRRSITELCNSGSFSVPPGSTFTLHSLAYLNHADDFIVMLNEDEAGELFINSNVCFFDSGEVKIRAIISLNRG